MEVPFTQEEIMQACLDAVAKNGEPAGYIRPIAYFGTGPMGVFPPLSKVSVEVMISIWKRGKYLSNDAIDVKVSRVRRIDPATTDMNAKICGNYANSIYASLDTKGAGFHE